MNADVAPSASPVLERTKSSLFGRFEPAEGLPTGPFKVCPHVSLGLISVQHHEVISYTLIENRVKGSRSQVESFDLQAQNRKSDTPRVVLPCAAACRCNPEKIFVLLSACGLGVDSLRAGPKFKQV